MPPPGAWEEEDEWYSDNLDGVRHLRPRRLSRGRFLSPQESSTTQWHHYRARSQGAAPTPHISIYNTIDDHQRVSQQSPLPSPRTSPRGRTARIADELEDLEALDALRIRARSRSRGPLFVEHDHNYERMQLELANERLRDRDRTRHDEELRDQVRREYELKQERDRYKRDAEEREESEERKHLLAIEALKVERARKAAEDERNRILNEERLKLEKAQRIADEERKRILDQEKLRQDKAKRDAEELKERTRAQWEREEKEAKAERQRAIDEWERKKRKEEAEAEAEKKRIVAEYEARKIADAKKAAEEAEAWRLKIKMEDEKRREKEQKEYEDFLRKQKEKEEAEKARKKAEEDKLADEMTKRLMVAGFQNNQIQAILKPDSQKNAQQGLVPANPAPSPGQHWHGSHQQPTYIKVNREHLSIDTLTYYDIPWEYDPHDQNYIIILRELNTKDTELLFEHTREIRARKTTRLLIEERGHHDKPQYAWVRHRSKSPGHRRRSSPKRVVGIKEMFF